jgi:hypothetical protein
MLQTGQVSIPASVRQLRGAFAFQGFLAAEAFGASEAAELPGATVSASRREPLPGLRCGFAGPNCFTVHVFSR